MGFFDRFKKTNDEEQRQKAIDERMKIIEEGRKQAREKYDSTHAVENTPFASQELYESRRRLAEINGAVSAMDNLPGSRAVNDLVSKTANSMLNEINRKKFEESSIGSAYSKIKNYFILQEMGLQAKDLETQNLESLFKGKQKGELMLPYLIEMEALGVITEEEKKILAHEKLKFHNDQDYAFCFTTSIISQAKAGLYGEKFKDSNSNVDAIELFKNCKSFLVELALKNSQIDDNTIKNETGRKR